MQANGGRIVVNPSFQEWVYLDEKSPHGLQTPMKRQVTYCVEEEIGPKEFEIKDDPWKQHNYKSKVDFVGAKSNGRCCRAAILMSIIIGSLMSIAALALVLLMLFGKVGAGCGCQSSSEVSPSAVTQRDFLAWIEDLQRNVTNLQQKLEKKTHELKVVHLSLRDLDGKLHNLTKKLNITETALQDKDNKFLVLLQNTTSNFLLKTDLIRYDLNSTRNWVLASDAELKNELEAVNTTLILKLNSTAERLDREDIGTITLLNNINSTLSLKLENVSKIPVGPRGFNGSQGPIGPAGPQGLNGTQGSQGFNGSQGPQGPKGAGDFSQCEHKTEDLVGNQSPITSNSIANPVKVIKGEPRGKKIVGVSCSTDLAQLYLLSTQTNPSNNQLFYYCSCYGHHGTGQASIQCVMNYWECPLTT